MEILFPAGSMKHVDVAIRSGANAVYGGFKKWNARDKADNFSFKQYKSVLNKLHSYGIKFYLTLNTLLFDEEIAEIIDLFKQHPEYLPDAFIVADLGLITELRKNFVQIPIHLSTQFGVHDSDDMKMAENLGAKRVVLARELTKDVVKQICNNSSLETECFVYGSQCISFSGQCYFSSLLNGGSGNRGKCEIFCRDNYSVKCAKGNLLYVPDMNCSAVIKDLPQVTSWKLEGRKRDPEQVGDYVNKLKTNQILFPQTGYMYGTTIEKNGLFNEKHLRAIPLLYTAPYDISGNNISFNVKSNNCFIQEITFVDNCGEGHKYKRYSPSEFIEFNPEDFAQQVQDRTKFNVYKIAGNENSDQQLFIDKHMLNDIIKNIPIKQKGKQPANIDPTGMWLETKDVSLLNSIQHKYPNITVVYNIATISNLPDAAKIGNKNTVYKLPMFNFENVDLYKYYAGFADKRVMFTHIGQLEAFKNIKLQERLTDYTIPVWNTKTLDYLKNNGVNKFTASPELCLEQNVKIFGDKNNTMYISYGKLPLVYTRSCFKHLFGCSECSGNQKKILKNTDKNIDFEIKCFPDYRVILPKQPMSNQFGPGINRVIIDDMNLEQIAHLISSRQTNNGYLCNQNTKRR